MSTLDHINAFLDTTKDAREYKRAMAVKLLLLEFEPRDIAEMLNVTGTFSDIKGAFERIKDTIFTFADLAMYLSTCPENQQTI